MWISSNAVSVSFLRPSGTNRYEKQSPWYPSMWVEREGDQWSSDCETQ